MNKATKLFLGAVTILPLIYVIFFFTLMFQAFYTMIADGSSEAILFRWFDSLFPVHLAMMLLNMILIVLYIIIVFKNERLKIELKVMWAGVIFTGSVFVMPVYWFLNIWRESKVAT